MFAPHGRALSPGSVVRIPALARVLEAGLSSFYNGNLSQEIVKEVRANGGVLSRVDISNYTAEVQQPLEGHFEDFIIQVPPPPSAGAALISVLKLLEDFHLRENNATENQTHQLNAEALRAAAASVLDGNTSNSSVTELLSHILSKSQADELWMNSSHASEYDSSRHPAQTEQIGGQVVVMGSDNLMVSVASSLSRAFGSRIVTPSGIILNSLLLDFSRSNEVGGRLQNVRNISDNVERRPELFLLPTIIIPARHRCGIRMAISSSGGQSHVKVMTQMLSAAPLIQKEENETHFIDRLQLLPKSHLLG
ncbi:glutathione hydrolase 7-like [Salarias fasciatus]|uniref:glutathione hydrolase 7-like n=1 Tax=Salarias fasciatus TaxID=181472 RepID=UPI0011769D3D|nr:glutathione hydrolase 7-like [Salarias fasciatus]